MASLTVAKDKRSAKASSSTQQAKQLLGVMRRIEAVIDEETASIRTDVNFDIAASNARKSRYLYDLNKCSYGLQPDDLQDEHRSSMLRLRGKLDENSKVISAHLTAVREVADILQTAIQRAEADGTYTANQFIITNP